MLRNITKNNQNKFSKPLPMTSLSHILHDRARQTSQADKSRLNSAVRKETTTLYSLLPSGEKISCTAQAVSCCFFVSFLQFGVDSDMILGTMTTSVCHPHRDGMMRYQRKLMPS